MKTLIGLSLSGCIYDILSGKADTKDILVLVTNTSFDNPRQAMDMYYHGYWHTFNKVIVYETLRDLWHLVYQPRQINGEDFTFSQVKGRWYDLTSGKGEWNPKVNRILNKF